MNNAPIKDNAREYGPREKITCNLPHLPRDNYGDRYPTTDRIMVDLETALCQQFGGYTATPSVGGWMDSDGNLVFERGTLYTVSYHLRHDESLEPKRDAAIALFVEAGERLGEEWVHIERSDFQAEHRRTSNGQGEYNNSLQMPDDEPSDKPPHDKPEAHNRDTCPRCILNGKASDGRYRSGADGQGFNSQRWNAAAKRQRSNAAAKRQRSNVERIRQLDKATRDHINNPGRSTEFVRR